MHHREGQHSGVLSKDGLQAAALAETRVHFYVQLHPRAAGCNIELLSLFM